MHVREPNVGAPSRSALTAAADRVRPHLKRRPPPLSVAFEPALASIRHVTLSAHPGRAPDGVASRYRRWVRITPRYDGPPVLRFEMPAADPSVPVLRQRRRLGAVISGLSDDQWSTPSRCEGWSVQDVVAHLIGTDQFWAASISAGLAGAPTRYLASFDPVVTPPQMVDGLRSMASSEVAARYLETVDALTQLLGHLDEAEWSRPAEAPPGHIAVHAVALHALWDAWIHERDIVLPLGLEPTLEDDEVAGCLRYAAALGPAFLASAGSPRRGSLTVAATEPEVLFVVDVGSTVAVSDVSTVPDGPCLAGPAVELTEGLSFRGPLDHGLDVTDQWLLGGLGEVFEQRRGSG